MNVFEDIVNRSSDFITLISRDYIYEVANDSYCEQIGKKRAEVVGHTVADVWGAERFEGSIKGYLDRCFSGEQVNYIDKFKFGPFDRHMHVTYFPRKEGERITHALVFSHDITQISEIESRLTNYEYRDPVTGLFNRRSMQIILDKEIEQARMSKNEKLRAVLFISVENLGRINELYGYEKGDLLLENTGLRVRKCLKAGDYVFRFEGKELAAVITVIPRKTDLAAVAQEVYNQVTLPYSSNGKSIVVGAAIGVSLYPDDGESSEAVIRKAHMAMSDAKGRRVPYVIFDPQLHMAAQDRYALEGELGSALANHQFELHYQPIVNNAGRILGAEALIRWRHPRLGLVPPMDFIPLAVDSGHIASIGKWVLFTACEQLARWSAEHDLFVSVNMSAREFTDHHLIDGVQAAIARARIRPDQLKIEITETECMEDPAVAAERMRQIQSLGVEVLIDDFGMGQSSLGYLRSLPCSALKLDKSFVKDLETREDEREFLRHLVSAIKSRIRKVVIEGVESAGQAWHARTLSCDLMQGSFFGWGVPPQEFEELLVRNAAAAEATAAEATPTESPSGT